MLKERIRKTYSLFEQGLDYHRQFLDRYLPDEGLIADVGCGECRVGWYYETPKRRFIGFDLDEVREREESLSYRLFSPLLKPHANSLLVIARKK